ncbi:MAG: helix-turn-helix domain-containing protein [Treponema sp.]|nr:helix-turn-helix domain-containing protein [Treponema sp.]
MESLGEKLKTAREEKGISLDDAGKDTKITIRYLEALEREDFSGFPGEAYITGFLRNYGAYLDLDVKELLSLYYALKIQEQPIPEQLLKKTPQILPKIIIGVLLGIIILGAGSRVVYYFINRPRVSRVTAPVVRTPTEYIMDGDNFQRHFYKGDSILVPAGTDQFKLELTDIGEEVTIYTPNGPVTVNLSQEANVDMGNGAPGIRISAMDYAKNNPDMGAILRLELNNIQTSSDNGPAAVPVVANQSASIMIFSSPNPYPFTLQANFQGYCMFRWEILMERDRRDRNERYFQRSDEMNIQAQNGIRLWVSNAQAVKFQVIGGGRTVPVEIGGPGEVVVADIRWVRDDDNRYRLVVLRLET